MFISGIVVLAADCPSVNKPWVLLVYGLVTMITWVWPLWAGIDRWSFSTSEQMEIEHDEYVFVFATHNEKLEIIICRSYVPSFSLFVLSGFEPPETVAVQTILFRFMCAL